MIALQSSAAGQDPGRPAIPGLVSIIIPCFNQSSLLHEAIGSISIDRDQDVEILVVDDGSSDETPYVVSRLPGARGIRQENQGPGSARNAGLRHTSGEFIVFLDADDRLTSEAISQGRSILAEHPEAGMTFGRHRWIDSDGTVLGTSKPQTAVGDWYLRLLEGNRVGMLGSAMFRRSALEEVGGFDHGLRRCEDYDLFLRIARRFDIISHSVVTAEYRLHAGTASKDRIGMLKGALQVLEAQRRFEDGIPVHRAIRRGRRNWRDHYAKELFGDMVRHTANRRLSQSLASGLDLLRASRLRAPLVLWRAGASQWQHWLSKLRRRFSGNRVPAVGKVRFGDLRRTEPLSRWFGYDRGVPVDRHYIEKFLTEHSDDITGRVLEIGDNIYTRRYGGDRVHRSDILHVDPGQANATYVDDLAVGSMLPDEAFDCVIVTQTLQLIYDCRSAVATLHRILKPGGVLLLTAPGISHTGDEEWRHTWYWSFTSASLARLFRTTFGEAVSVVSHGNVLASASFLYGLSATELQTHELEQRDPDYPTVLTVRATKSPEKLDRDQ